MFNLRSLHDVKVCLQMKVYNNCLLFNLRSLHDVKVCTDASFLSMLQNKVDITSLVCENNDSVLSGTFKDSQIMFSIHVYLYTMILTINICG